MGNLPLPLRFCSQARKKTNLPAEAIAYSPMEAANHIVPIPETFCCTFCLRATNEAVMGTCVYMQRANGISFIRLHIPWAILSREAELQKIKVAVKKVAFSHFYTLFMEHLRT